MKTLRNLLKAMDYRGHISLRRRLLGEIQYIGGGTSDAMIDRYGGYRVEYTETIENVLIIYVK